MLVKHARDRRRWPRSVCRVRRNAPPLISEPALLGEVWEELERAPMLALDLEMDSFYSYFGKVCLVQLSTENADFLLDPLAGLNLSPLGAILADKSKIKILHAGENDIPYLRGPLGFETVRNVFDTYLAARILGYTRCGLAALLEEHFQITLDKEMQTADWRQRPLTAEQEEYARTDTRYLIPLRDVLLNQLRENDKLEQARSEFERILDRVHVPRQFDPTGWTRIRNVRDLNGLGRAILSELYRWRDEEARRRDQAAFRVVSDRQLCELARKAPTTLAEMPDHAHRAELWAAVQRGHERGFLSFPEPAKNKLVENRLSRAEQEVYDRIRKWRNEAAAEAGVEADQIVPNRLLKLVARSVPANRAELAGVPGFEPWRVEQHGEALLAALASPAE